MGAFRTTLEELRDADMLLHVVDASARDPDAQITAVEAILGELALDALPRVLVLNKCDRLAPEQAQALCRRYGTVGISALDPTTLMPMIERLDLALAERPRSLRVHQEPWRDVPAGTVRRAGVV
jgi:GTP-binding protein HflX